MTATHDKRLFTFRIPAVQKSIERLSNRRSHEQLPGYLALLHLGIAQGSVDVDAAAIHTFRCKFLMVKGAPAANPFIQPFRSRGKGVKLTNKNTAGSYAEKSIREGQALSNVLEMVPSTQTGSNVAYRFKEDHAEAVLSAMLGGTPILAASLAVFLFRDRALRIDPNEPSQIIDIVRDWLNIGPNILGGDEVFSTLFVDDSDEFSVDDFELYEGESEYFE